MENLAQIQSLRIVHILISLFGAVIIFSLKKGRNEKFLNSNSIIAFSLLIWALSGLYNVLAGTDIAEISPITALCSTMNNAFLIASLAFFPSALKKIGKLSKLYSNPSRWAYTILSINIFISLIYAIVISPDITTNLNTLANKAEEAGSPNLVVEFFINFNKVIEVYANPIYSAFVLGVFSIMLITSTAISKEGKRIKGLILINGILLIIGQLIIGPKFGEQILSYAWSKELLICSHFILISCMIILVMRQGEDVNPINNDSSLEGKTKEKGLTITEMKVYVGLASGLNAKEMAEFFIKAEPTIRAHIKNIREKLNIKDIDKLTTHALSNLDLQAFKKHKSKERDEGDD